MLYARQFLAIVIRYFNSDKKNNNKKKIKIQHGICVGLHLILLFWFFEYSVLLFQIGTGLILPLFRPFSHFGIKYYVLLSIYSE